MCLVFPGGFAGAAGGGPVPDYDWEWAVIGDPGNRETMPEEAPGL